MYPGAHFPTLGWTTPSGRYIEVTSKGHTERTGGQATTCPYRPFSFDWQALALVSQSQWSSQAAERQGCKSGAGWPSAANQVSSADSGYCLSRNRE